jgi:hypothetical protein
LDIAAFEHAERRQAAEINPEAAPNTEEVKGPPGFSS